MGGVLKSVTQSVGSLLGTEAPATPAAAVPATPAVRATPAAAITTAQPAIAAGAKTSLGATPRARIRGSRSASVLTADLGDSKLGG